MVIITPQLRYKTPNILNNKTVLQDANLELPEDNLIYVGARAGHIKESNVRNVPGNRRFQHQFGDNFDKVQSVTTEECHRIA